uniref:hypothetical protein n=1 Tax=Paenibacillus sp. FSL W7-1332 TaxID=2921702 RepID=UPI00403FBB2C
MGTVAITISAFWIPENKLYAASLFAVLMVGAIHAHLVSLFLFPYMAIHSFISPIYAEVALPLQRQGPYPVQARFGFR